MYKYMQVCTLIFATNNVEKNESLWISDNETKNRTYHPAVILSSPQRQKYLKENKEKCFELKHSSGVFQRLLLNKTGCSFLLI